MTVKELKSLFELPEGVSQEEFDNLEVLVFNEEVNNILNPCRVSESGYSIFGGNCDEKGNLIGEDAEEEKYDHAVFLISI
jgi:hypothetical protein